ncbi:uncharacterized protein BT62DRAFT_931123 [Guyanagaster necrorhizus]|uniref:Centrosomin N-terminal motif 1 domain-containing protein n=1 Tax=Guyanagaster necrorhizus TaxID=856835 RepID=A0A9P8ATR1_9AGAR|nr:uncharacterized protein BT62DRAFT_931123 [Guyanagaster necrorhizus MCA 3950]KAG7447276.1 hypothetical protein BT62DRAFT_931123 [Guyanagaster necrorhizus MCA 3950]
MSTDKVDISLQSTGSQPDISLGSLDSSFSPPQLPSNTSNTNPLATPVVQQKGDHSRRNIGASTYFDETDGDFLDTPDTEKQRWGDGATETPTALRAKRKSGAKGALTLRDQEKHIDHLKKENFDIKIKCHFLEERLAQLAPDQMDAALKQNIDLKIELSARGQEIKRLKKLLLELERELERMQRGAGGARGRERDLEEKLEERDREIRELRRRQQQQNGHGHDKRTAELEGQLEDARDLLEENNAEIERLRDMVERGGNAGDSQLKQRVAELEAANTEWQQRMQNMADDHDEEKQELIGSIESMGLKIEKLQHRNEAQMQERSESRAMVLDEREHREAVEDDLNQVKDRLAAALIELQQKDDEIDLKNEELDNLVAQHETIVEQWRGEVEETRNQVEELRDVLAERDAESKDLRLNINELEANTEDLHTKFEAALAHLEHEAEEKDSEIETLTEAVKELGEQVYNLEDERDRIRDEADRLREDDDAERDRLEAIQTALKEKLSQVKAQYETCSQEIHAHRARQEELAQHVEELVEEVECEREARERSENVLEEVEKKCETDLRRERRALEAKESALQSALNDLSRAQSLLSQRETDLQAVQVALQMLESESKRAGETHTTAQFSLQLEVDRLKRDLERVEDELARARKELSERESKSRDRDSDLDKLHGDNRELSTQLAAQTQARLNISEKLDMVQSNLRASEGEVATFKARITELEARLGKDQRSLLNAESQYRDQLTERNTLLLTIYQYMDKILGVDKTPKKGGHAETKPFTNFSVFHDNLITRLKALSQIELDFDKRCKEVEGRYTEKLTDMRKQLDGRWKQIDKFEASIKAYAEVKAGWRRKFSAKEGELEAIKTTNADMVTQLASMRRPGQTDSMEMRSLSTRAVNAERRLNNTQNQLLATEEKMAQMSQKSSAADAKWEARVKEYETRLKAAEERVKRERQGGKERVAELESNIKALQRQLDLAQRRSHQLNDVIDANRAAGSPGSNF